MPALFVIGTARSGTNLAARLLSLQPEIALAIDPLLPLFRSVRNAVLRHAGIEHDPHEPLQDYYFSDLRLRQLDAIQAGTLALVIDAGGLAGLREALRARTSLEEPGLADRLGALSGETYAELVEEACAVIAEARGAASNWVGTKEVWTIEFVPLLLDAFPDARIVLVERDPRAVLASMHVLGERHPSQRAHPLSYARHWRKAVAFREHYRRDPRLAGRLHVLRYEQLVADPEATLSATCSFLDLELDEAMLDARNLTDARGGPWTGNSSYTSVAGRIAPEPLGAWRERLPAGARALVELTCGPEMALAGYEHAAAIDEEAAFAYLAATNGGQPSWRSDSGDADQEQAAEQWRRTLIAGGRASEPEARRALLFSELLDQVAGR